MSPGDHTSVFTLPSPRKERLQKQVPYPQSPSSAKATEAGSKPTTPPPLTPSNNNNINEDNDDDDNKMETTVPLHHCATDHTYYEELGSNNERSPNLPWLVEYWSSSFFRAPSFVMDQLCTCSASAAMVVDAKDNSNKNSNNTGHARRSRSNSSSSSGRYFDDTILRSDPKVERSPTKISQTRWEALRAVVASHGDYTIQDYCDFYEQAVESMPMETRECYSLEQASGEEPQAHRASEHQVPRAQQQQQQAQQKDDDDDPSNGRYPTKPNLWRKPSSRNQLRRSSILLTDDSKDNEEQPPPEEEQREQERHRELVHELLLLEAPRSPGARSEPSMGSLAPHRRNAEQHNDDSGRILRTCHSFDQYLDTSRYLCANGTNHHARGSTPGHAPTGSRSNPASPRGHASAQGSPHARLYERRRARRSQMRAQSMQSSPLSPRTPAFQRLSHRTTPPSPSPSAADTCTTISLSQSFDREFDEDCDDDDYTQMDDIMERDILDAMQQHEETAAHGSRLVLDRLSSGTYLSMSPTSSPNRTPIRNRSPSHSPFRRLRPRTKAPRDEGHDRDGSDPYRCLVRMSPKNYRHEFTKSQADLWTTLGGGSGAEESKQELGAASSYNAVVDDDDDLFSTASSSVLLPLHPHQRIMAPLPHEESSFEVDDHSGYTCFRDSLGKEASGTTRLRASSSPAVTYRL